MRRRQLPNLMGEGTETSRTVIPSGCFLPRGETAAPPFLRVRETPGRFFLPVCGRIVRKCAPCPRPQVRPMETAVCRGWHHRFPRQIMWRFHGPRISPFPAFLNQDFQSREFRPSSGHFPRKKGPFPRSERPLSMIRFFTQAPRSAARFNFPRPVKFLHDPVEIEPARIRDDISGRG